MPLGGTVNSIIAVPGPGGPWRLAVIDRDPADPKLMLATIVLAEDVTPVQLKQGRFYDWRAVLAFVTARGGQPVELTPFTEPTAWSVSPRRPR
jgi:hypothetical protein